MISEYSRRRINEIWDLIPKIEPAVLYWFAVKFFPFAKYKFSTENQFFQSIYSLYIYFYSPSTAFMKYSKLIFAPIGNSRLLVG